MSGITIFEFDAVTADRPEGSAGADLHAVPPDVYAWLEAQSLQGSMDGESAWCRMTQRRGRRAVQVTSFVGVVRAPSGLQIEILPKVGRVIGGGAIEARRLLLDMLCCLQEFRHIQADAAKLLAASVPLMDVFIAEFLRSVQGIVKRGLRGDYSGRRDNLFALRGKLHIADHLRQNLCRADRFYSEYDEFSSNRPENRLLHAALRRVLALTAMQSNQQLARELSFVFADVPVSNVPRQDFRRVHLDRGMSVYADALAWARLILDDVSPLTGSGRHMAPSLLFPMETVFEAFVAKHLGAQLAKPLMLKRQVGSRHLVSHLDQGWFRLKPDLVVRDADTNKVVLDTKWKLLDSLKANGTEKYGLAQGDFYQLQAYGQSYLQGEGDVVLVYPKTDALSEPLPVFRFVCAQRLRLWVLPFCLTSRRMAVPEGETLRGCFV